MGYAAPHHHYYHHYHHHQVVNTYPMCVLFKQIGSGVFVASAGENRIMLHQAANDGLRGLYMLCFEGPDAGKGFVILSNGDNPAVAFQCELCRVLLGNGPTGTCVRAGVRVHLSASLPACLSVCLCMSTSVCLTVYQCVFALCVSSLCFHRFMYECNYVYTSAQQYM
jgi:hypothetical protein